MKNSPYTPGPWRFSFSTPHQESEKHGGGNCGGNSVIQAETDKKIFDRPTYDNIAFLPHWRDNKQDEEMKANAQLIAASPDLLEALKNLLSSYEADFKTITGGELNETDAVKKAKRAIQKAETGKEVKG